MHLRAHTLATSSIRTLHGHSLSTSIHVRHTRSTRTSPRAPCSAWVGAGHRNRRQGERAGKREWQRSAPGSTFAVAAVAPKNAAVALGRAGSGLGMLVRCLCACGVIACFPMVSNYERRASKHQADTLIPTPFSPPGTAGWRRRRRGIRRIRRRKQWLRRPRLPHSADGIQPGRIQRTPGRLRPTTAGTRVQQSGWCIRPGRLRPVGLRWTAGRLRPAAGVRPAGRCIRPAELRRRRIHK